MSSQDTVNSLHDPAILLALTLIPARKEKEKTLLFPFVSFENFKLDNLFAGPRKQNGKCYNNILWSKPCSETVLPSIRGKVVIAREMYNERCCFQNGVKEIHRGELHSAVTRIFRP